jgi:hypothetical protein
MTSSDPLLCSCPREYAAVRVRFDPFWSILCADAGNTEDTEGTKDTDSRRTLS